MRDSVYPWHTRGVAWRSMRYADFGVGVTEESALHGLFHAVVARPAAAAAATDAAFAAAAARAVSSVVNLMKPALGDGGGGELHREAVALLEVGLHVHLDVGAQVALIESNV